MAAVLYPEGAMQIQAQIAEANLGLIHVGDPVEIGKALDRVHRPWLGWLWLVSKALAVLSLIVVLLYGGSNYMTIVQDLEWPEKETDYEADG